MAPRFRVAMAQIDTTVGDFDGNTRKIVERLEEAQALGVDVVAFPELSVTGYPPEDLLIKTDFIDENLSCLDEIARHAVTTAAVVGFADSGDHLYNAAAVMHEGRIIADGGYEECLRHPEVRRSYWRVDVGAEASAS